MTEKRGILESGLVGRGGSESATPRVYGCSAIAGLAAMIGALISPCRALAQAAGEVPAALAPVGAPTGGSGALQQAAPPAHPESGIAPYAGASVQERAAEFLRGHPDLPCDFRESYALGERVWVACGGSGLLVLSDTQGTLNAIERRDLGGSVQGFFSSGGRVWVRTTQEHALVIGESGRLPEDSGPPSRPLPGLTPPPTNDLPVRPESPPDSPPPQPPPEVPTGTVVAVEGREVTINLGAVHGLQLRDKISMQLGDVLVVGGEEDTLRPRVVVAAVVELWKDRARLRTGVNEVVKVGMFARPTFDESTKSRVAPPRVAEVWELRLFGRPMFNLGEVGGGLLAEASIGRRSSMWHYGAALNPVGVGGDAKNGATLPWAGYVFGAFDSKAFSAGLGVGAQTVNFAQVETGSGLGVVQLLRLGSVDGLHLGVRSSVVIFHSETEFATLDIQGQLAVGEAAWLLLRGGGGSVGYGYGEVALRSLMRGNGGPGSFFFEVSVGGSALIRDTCEFCTTQVVGGPMVGLGGEWRF